MRREDARYLWAMSGGDVSAGERQQALYDELWEGARSEAFSPDLIRFRIWGRYLRSPVLDIGAGDALLARYFASFRVFSADLSDVGLRHAPGPALVAAAEAVPLRSASMRSVVLSEVLEHAEEPARVLGECRRVLAADGVFLMSTPLWPVSTAEYAYHWRRMKERPSLENLAKWDPNHERRYDLHHLQAEVRAAGFAIQEVIPLFRSVTSSFLYVVEPLAARVTGRHPRWAQRFTGVDRLLGRADHPSSVALACLPI